MANRFIDLTGKKFNRLTVLRHAGTNSQRVSMWECLCDCGETKVVDSGNLKKGGIKSCGCLQRETGAMTILINGDSTTHGMARTSVYRSWQAMKKRCTYLKDKDYKNYGGRGIKVCDQWLNDFEKFFEDMGEKPTPKHSLDRWPNKDGNYEPSNCRWATQKQQQNNRTNNRLFYFRGQSLTISQWSDRVGIKASIIRDRLTKHKWSIEKSLTV